MPIYFMMNRIRLYRIIAVSVLSMLLHQVVVAEDIQLDDLYRKINELTIKINRMEKTITDRLSALEKGIAAPAAVAKPKLDSKKQTAKDLEKEARKVYGNLVRMASEAEFDQLKSEIPAFIEKYGTTKVARRARKLQREVAVVGKELPADWGIDIWFQGEDTISLSSDKTTVLVFWETWCPHCIREIPKLQQLYYDFRDQEFQLLGLTKINKSSTVEKVQELIEEEGIDYAIAKEDGSITEYFNVTGVPAAAVVKDGIIVWRGHPAHLSARLLERWL